MTVMKIFWDIYATAYLPYLKRGHLLVLENGRLLKRLRMQ